MKFLLVLTAVVALASAGTVDPALKAQIMAGQVSEAIIELPQIMEQVETSATLQSLSGEEKITAMVATLEGLTGAAQAPFVTVAKSMGLVTEQFWASNIILVKGLTAEKLAKLAETPGKFHIRPQHWAHMIPHEVHEVFEVSETNVSQTAQWGVAQIRAPTAWSTTQGANTIACIIDTGVNQGHTALSAGYAGQWRDPYYNTAGPTDQQGHGSHCAGSIVGRANGVGVAPAARWVACRGLNHQGSGSESALTTCAQWVLTIPAATRPTVVSNSWGGGSGSNWYNTQVSAWRNANIIPVFAMGNSGPNCRTANSPGDQPNLIGVGSTTNTDAMSSFSSRGPGTSVQQKPEVSAPGSNIVSCGTGASNYATMSGTSMATPHVAGAVCLLRSAHPTWTYAQVLSALQTRAVHPTLSTADRNCGLPGSGNFPNYAFGHGRIDVAAAI
jgi:subtilisin family serine protease